MKRTLAFYISANLIGWLGGCHVGKNLVRFNKREAIIILSEPEILPCIETHDKHKWHSADATMYCLNDRIERALEVLK